MNLLPEHRAPQHERAPRPLPLFLELVRRTAERQPQVAQQALAGLAAYSQAERGAIPAPRPELARIGPAALRDHGGSGPPALLVPSLINPPDVLDLDDRVSLAAAVSKMGRRALLLDWGEAAGRAELSVAGHIEHLLLPLMRELGEPAALIGYCLGGTMAIAAANLAPVERVATLAAPWRFANYPADAQAALKSLWLQSKPVAEQVGALPMEVLQAAFWSIDPERTVAKFAQFAELDPGSDKARRFVALEDWANEGEPLPLPAAGELIEDLFGADLPGQGRWQVGGREVTSALAVPVLHFTAGRDRIAPAATAAEGSRIDVAAGHVGMIVGGKACEQLHQPLGRWLSS
jgi:polyhydroxyalkanoate synthase